MIKLESVSLIYPPDRVIFRDVNLEINRGELLNLTGPIGSGKSSLFRLIMRFDKPNRGRVLIFGRDIWELDKKEIPFLRRRFGFISQDTQVMLSRTVMENLVDILEGSGVTGKRAISKADELLKSVGLEFYKNYNAAELSRVQKLKLIIARAISLQPSVIIADEPLYGLGNEDIHYFTKLILDMHKEGVTVLWSSKDITQLDGEPKIIELVNKSIQVIRQPTVLSH